MKFASPQILVDLVKRHKEGAPVGIPSICSANRLVLEAAMHLAEENGEHLLIEATCNQVNQYGGYTGMTPIDFANYVREIADIMSFPQERILLGGDHLGPFPWQDLNSDQAMENAVALVRAFVQAGFGKIHLDTSMRCADDDPALPLSLALCAQRAARMCRAVEDACAADSTLVQPVYVIGSEVPVPGGTQEKEETLCATDPADAAGTIAAFREVFEREGLQAAWKRVIALVVQPGVEFGDEDLFAYDEEKARRLSQYIETVPGMIYEAHSTDYQQPEHLRQMVEDHFVILKVGPGLTFAMREAVFALARMEAEVLNEFEGENLSQIIETLDAAMLRNPKYWQKYYSQETSAAAYARKYSLSDRIRYYWNDPEVELAFNHLLANLEAHPVPLTLLSQYMPAEHASIRKSGVIKKPRQLIWTHIEAVLADYWSASRGGEHILNR